MYTEYLSIIIILNKYILKMYVSSRVRCTENFLYNRVVKKIFLKMYVASRVRFTENYLYNRVVKKIFLKAYVIF
jgi:hypothetical protein